MRLHDIIDNFDLRAWIDPKGELHKFDNETHLDYLLEIDPDDVDDPQDLFHHYLENGWIRVGVDGKEFYVQGLLKYTTKSALKTLYTTIGKYWASLYNVDFEDLEYKTFQDSKKALNFISKLISSSEKITEMKQETEYPVEETELMIEDFERAFDKAGLRGKVSVSLRPCPYSPHDVVEFMHIGTEWEFRKTGMASKAIELLTQYADKYNVILKLGVDYHANGQADTLTKQELKKWYHRWGFEGDTSMIRRPERQWNIS